MPNTIQHKRSTTSGTTPTASDLAVGEIAINTADGKLFTKHGTSVVTLNATAAQGTAADNALPKSGGTMTGDIVFGDDVNATFGAGTDLQIRHESSGNHSVIRESGSGSLYIDATNLFLRSRTFENMAKFYADGAVELYYNNDKKFETTNTGVKLVGPSGGGNLDLNGNQITNGTGATQFAYGAGFINCGTSGGFGLRLGSQGNYSLDITNGQFNPSFSRVAQFTTYDSCDLYFNGTKRFETTNTGIDVTGEIKGDSAVIEGDIKFGSSSATGTDRIMFNSYPTNTSYHAVEFIRSTVGFDFVFGEYAGDKALSYGGAYSNRSGGLFNNAMTYSTSSGFSFTDDVSVTGDITATGDVTAFSDARLKENIETIDNALDKVCNLRGVSYDKDGKKGIGVIAQEVEEIIPEVVGTHNDKDATRTVAYGNMVGVLIEAIKEQQQQIEDLKAKVTELGGYD